MGGMRSNEFLYLCRTKAQAAFFLIDIVVNKMPCGIYDLFVESICILSLTLFHSFSVWLRLQS